MHRLFHTGIVVLGLCLAAPAYASVATPPAIYGSDKIEPGKKAFVESQIAKFNAKTAPDPEAVVVSLLALDPRNANYMTALAGYASAARDFSFLAEILAVLPDSGPAAWAMAEKLNAQGYHALAVPYYRIAATAYPENYEGQKKAGLNAYFAGDYAACVRHYDDGYNPGNPYGFSADDYAKKGECQALLGEKKAADQSFKNAVKRNAGAAMGYGARMFNDDVFDGCRGSSGAKTESARRHFEKGRAYEAYRDVNAALICDPLHVPALELRIEIEAADGNLAAHAAAHRRRLQNVRDGGQTDARAADMLKPRSAQQLLAEAGRLDMASSRNIVEVAYLAARALELEPDSWEAHLYRARALVNYQRPELYPMAWDDVAQADVASGPSPVARAQMHNVRGHLFYRAKLLPEALNAFNQAVALNPDDMRFHGMRAVLLRQLQQPEAAMAEVNFVLQREPDNALALGERFKLYEKQGKWAAARADLERLYALQPGNGTARGEIIRMLDMEGRTAEADERHTQFLIDDEAEAGANPYLAQRSGGKVQAKARSAREKKASEAAREAAQEAFYDVEYAFERGEDAMADSALYMQKLINSGQQFSYANEGKEVVGLIDVAIKRFTETKRLITRLRASDQARYLTTEEMTQLDEMFEISSARIETLMDAHRRYTGG